MSNTASQGTETRKEKKGTGRNPMGTMRRARSYLFARAANVTSDAGIAFRKLRKSPGFAVTAILTLALGIGANAVVFSVLNAVVLRPVNVPNAQNLYMVQRFQYPSQSYPDYLDLRDRNRTFESLVTVPHHGSGGGGYRRESVDGMAVPGEWKLLRRAGYSAVSGAVFSCRR